MADPTHQPQPEPAAAHRHAKYTVRFKAADKQPKGLSVTRGTLVQLNYQGWTEQDWQAALPQAKPEDQRRLSELIKQKLAANK